MAFSFEPNWKGVEEKTEVIYGEENIKNATLDLFSNARYTLHNCIHSIGVTVVVASGHPILNALHEMQKRGVKIKFITEITQNNLNQCKELMKCSQVRHLDDLKGNFGILDGIHYRATARVRAAAPPPLLLSSTVHAFVEQQEYLFDILWKKSIPAIQRIKEIEENLKREFIVTIRDSDETVSLISKVLSSASEEIQLIFSSKDSLKKFFELGMLDLMVDKARNGILVRILLGTNDPINSIELNPLTGHDEIEIRYLNKSIQTRITTIITDRELSLTIEQNEMADPFDIGLTTYSNSDSTVFSYASIFENLWMQSNTTILS
jgi:two-component system, OmpR family, sensor histidine kinase VicK